MQLVSPPPPQHWCPRSCQALATTAVAVVQNRGPQAHGALELLPSPDGATASDQALWPGVEVAVSASPTDLNAQLCPNSTRKPGKSRAPLSMTNAASARPDPHVATSLLPAPDSCFRTFVTRQRLWCRSENPGGEKRGSELFDINRMWSYFTQRSMQAHCGAKGTRMWVSSPL